MMFPLRAALFAALLTILPTWAQEPAAELSEAFSAAKNGFLADELRRVDAREDDS